MQERVFTDRNGTKYKRVNKTRAHRLFNDGSDLVICAVNMRPFGPWHTEAHILHESAEKWYDTGVFPDFFEYYSCMFTAYNCINSETGLYPAFYVAC